MIEGRLCARPSPDSTHIKAGGSRQFSALTRTERRGKRRAEGDFLVREQVELAGPEHGGADLYADLRADQPTPDDRTQADRVEELRVEQDPVEEDVVAEVREGHPASADPDDANSRRGRRIESTSGLEPGLGPIPRPASGKSEP